MAVKQKLSVILPTYNCAKLMGRHLASMAGWAHLAEEIIVVDSRSTDGTLELIRERLRHPNLRIIERDRGLYESWNTGIAASSGDWVYVSTAGDLITGEHLQRLMREGEHAGADVVISPQSFVAEDGMPYQGDDYVNAEIHADMAGRGVVALSPVAVHFFAFSKSKPNALLGSWASDLFRGDFLRARPLPTEYGTHGDTAWTLRHSAEMRLCLVPIAGATFCIHEKPSAGSTEPLGQLLGRMFLDESERLRRNPGWIPAKYQALRLLSEKTKAAALLRRELSRGTALRPRDRIAWIPASIRYLYLRMRLSFAEASMRRKVLRGIRPLN